MSEITKMIKTEYTENERLQLAAKLDAELDEFIDNLEKRRYTEGWPEDKWQEEMEKHPFFMKNAPKPGDEVHPMFEGLQKLKYDPNENSKEELSLNYKEDGNFYMKHKKFRMAIYSYTEGLAVNCDDAYIQAMLYNNRSAAHFLLMNYRSALSDALKALQYKSDYEKARWRAAECAYKLDRFDLCSELCKAISMDSEYAAKAIELSNRNKLKKITFLRDERKTNAAARKNLQNTQKICRILQRRRIKFFRLPFESQITAEILKPKYLPLENYGVHFDDDGKSLIWPAAFSYPEFLFSDFQQEVSENATILDCLEQLFEDPSECNHKLNNYRMDNVHVYYENPEVNSAHKVNLNKPIKEIITEDNFYIIGGSLLFFVVTKGTKIERDFLNAKRKGTIYT